MSNLPNVFPDIIINEKSIMSYEHLNFNLYDFSNNVK